MLNKNFTKPITHTLIIFCLMISVVFAAGVAQKLQNPANVIRESISKLQSQVKAEMHTDISGENAGKLQSIVLKILLPYIDIDFMATRTLGKKWRTASKAQRQEFITQFSMMLVRTYSAALLKVSSLDVKVFPMRGKSWMKKKVTIVNGQIINHDSGSVANIAYYVQKSGNSWKIYDFAVEGIGFLNNFKEQFKQFATMQDLLKRIKKLNAANSKS
ncbi:MAG: hypothetical protein COC15_03240 [Legionellales bacterium]|nr:MAG: hypothetical protein COC15_03240 [Legionellales bacterium]